VTIFIEKLHVEIKNLNSEKVFDQRVDQCRSSAKGFPVSIYQSTTVKLSSKDTRLPVQDVDIYSAIFI
jgi:hypothetical protein